MTITDHDQYSLWIEGLASPQQAATELAAQLKDVQFHKEQIEERERIIRNQLSDVVASHGQPIIAMGLKLELTAPGVTVTYPKADVEQFILRLLEDGQGELAIQLQGLAKRSERAGGLRVTKEKAKP